MKCSLIWEKEKLAGGGCDQVCSYGHTGVRGAEEILQNDFLSSCLLSSSQSQDVRMEVGHMKAMVVTWNNLCGKWNGELPSKLLHEEAHGKFSI